MSELTDEGRKIALDAYGARLAPAPGDISQLIAASVCWGPFTPGDYVTLSTTDEAWLATGDASVVATTSHVPLPAGLHDFVIPVGASHVALISSVSGARAAAWRS